MSYQHSRFPGWQADALYLGDNGRALCGEHLGATAKTTGRDLSGHNVTRVTPEMLRHHKETKTIRCEHPKCTRAVSWKDGQP